MSSRTVPLAALVLAGLAGLVGGAACGQAGGQANERASSGPVPLDPAVGDDGTVVATTRPARPTTTASPAPPRKVSGSVALVGDSLTVGAEEALAARAVVHGFSLDINARDGRRTGEGAAEVAKLAPGHDLVAVALGTNDATRRDFTAEAARVLIDDTLAGVDPGVTVLWVNVYRDPGSSAGEAAERFNEALEDAVERHPNLVPLDWDGWVADHPDVVADDRIHLTDEGYLARAAWLAAAIADHLPEA